MSIEYTCVPYSKECPVNNVTCSGQGSCIYMDDSGNAISECLVTNSHCTALCQCYEGYGGVDCALDGDVFNATQDIRSTLCSALINNTLLADSSADMLDTYSASLQDIIDPTEIYDRDYLLPCITAMNGLLEIASDGYMIGTVNAATNLVNVLSLLLDTAKKQKSGILHRYWDQIYEYNGTAIDNSNGRRLNEDVGDGRHRELDYSTTSDSWLWNTSSFDNEYNVGLFRHELDAEEVYAFYNINSSLQHIIQSVHSDMLAGESARAITTSNIRISIQYILVADLPALTITAPQTSEEALYGNEMPSITFPSSGLDSCRIMNSDYVQIALLSYGYVPYSNSGRLRAPLLRYSVSLPPSASNASSNPLVFNGTDPLFVYDVGHSGSHSAYDSSSSEWDAVKCRGYTCYDVDVSSTFSITLPFYTRMDWHSREYYPMGERMPGVMNITKPSCIERVDGDSYRYEPNSLSLSNLL